MPALRIPTATYRIQFSLAFRFVDGRDLVPYLNALGIGDLYSSPRFKARRGSPHAYDVANPLRINSELGTEDEFEELAQKLNNYGMGLVLDVVPNHMAASSENPWWLDVLENGRCSRYAAHFAIDWGRTCLKTTGPEKLVLPILGAPYGTVLENQEFNLRLDENGFFVQYYDHRLPLDPRSYRIVFEVCRDLVEEGPRAPELRARFDRLAKTSGGLPADFTNPELMENRRLTQDELKRELWTLYHGDPEFRQTVEACLIRMGGAKGDPDSFDLLDRILSEQSYRVAYWRMAAEELNYRRFFDINDLVGVRVEEPAVFEERHQRILELTHRGGVTGLRVDHIDGLWDPHAYLRRLRARAAGRNTEADGCAEFYIIVEKILGGDEELPLDWPACGTVGYDFLNQVNGIFVNPEGLEALGEIYSRFTGITATMAEVQYHRKKQVMEELFPGEVRALGYHLGRLAAQDRFARDLPFQELVQALVEVSACLPVYRTYIRCYKVPPRDCAYIERALEEAERVSTGISPGVFPFLRRVLLLEIPHHIQHRDEWLGFVMCWQQFTGPVMAKGFEDTTCYYYNRLISQNEVGSDPELADHPVDVEAFHDRNLTRLARWPHSMNTTSTHDTKRSEDARARIDVLSEIPQLWARRLARWSALNAPKKRRINGRPAPDRNDEILLYQTMVGAWPLCAEDVPAFADRLKNFAQKAVREAKTNSNWLRPDEEYEGALLDFIDRLLEESDSNAFLKDFLTFQKRIAPAGAINALAQVLLKIASPGLPDFYQGTELWDLSLVDPDNRRPVDFTLRAALLDELKRRESQELPRLRRDLTVNWQDGRIKLYLTYKALNFRRSRAELFQQGAYLPVDGGPHVCSFLRRFEDHWALVAVPRLIATLEKPSKRLAVPKQLGGELVLPRGAPRNWRNVLTGEDLDSLRLADLFASFPVALLEPR